MARWPKMVTKGKCYAIYYFDHYAHPSKAAWVKPRKVKVHDCKIVTVGFAVKETEKYIALAQTVDEIYDPTEAMGNVWMINKGAIDKVVEILKEDPV